jgi:hypothetical protein
MEQNTTIKLDRNIDKDALYFIDWSKLRDVNDLVLIIASLGISMSPMHPAWEQIEHLMDLSRPVKPGEPQTKMEKIELPKLKMVKK